MQLAADKLTDHLKKGIAPVYLLSGDEPFQLMEAADSIRSCARDDGYSEREVLHVESGFDWTTLQAVSGNLSLFEQRRLIELRMPGKPGMQGAKLLINYTKHPAEDTILIIQTGKLDRSSQNSAWVKSIDSIGVVLRVWPLNATQMQQWIRQRFEQYGFTVDRESVDFMASRVEGNLISASQEIDKIGLTYESGYIDHSALLDSVADSSRYSIFDLADAALGGETARAVKVFFGLRAEGVKLPLVLWSLAEQVRTMVSLSRHLTGGAAMDSVLRSVWQNRKSLVRGALQRRNQAGWEKLIVDCARIDRTIKSQPESSAWEELLQLTFDISSKESPKLLIAR